MTIFNKRSVKLAHFFCLVIILFGCTSAPVKTEQMPEQAKERSDLPPPVLAAIKDKSWKNTKLVAETWMLVRSSSAGNNQAKALEDGEKKASYMALMATTGSRFSEATKENIRGNTMYEFKVTGGKMIEKNCRGKSPATCSFTYMIHLKDLRAIDMK